MPLHALTHTDCHVMIVTLLLHMFTSFVIGISVLIIRGSCKSFTTYLSEIYLFFCVVDDLFYGVVGFYLALVRTFFSSSPYFKTCNFSPLLRKI